MTAGAQTEQFDQPGSDWADTIFADTALAPDAVFSRGPLLGPSVPNTTPPLPVNFGTDKEGRLTDATLDSFSYGLLDDVPGNVWDDQSISGSLGVEFGGASGSDRADVGFVVRGDASGAADTFTGYRCVMRAFASGSAVVRIVRDDGPGLASILYESDVFPFDAGSENLKLKVVARGEIITMDAHRVYESGGAVLEQPVDLDAGTGGAQPSAWVVDATYAAGRAGVVGRPDDAVAVMWEGCVCSELPCDHFNGFEPPITPGVSTTLGYLGTTDGIDVFHATGYDCLGNPNVGTVGVVPLGSCGFGDGQVGFTGNGNYMFDFTGLPGNVSRVTLEWFEQQGCENLGANAEPVEVVEFDDWTRIIAPGVTATSIVEATDSCGAGNSRGVLIVDVNTALGTLDRLTIGGQEFELDNVCVTLEPGCPCDIDMDGDLDPDDISKFVDDFIVGTSEADCDGDGDIDPDDISCFVDCFTSGC